MLTNDAIGFITMGAIFGFTAGISPGPLLALVISETVTHGKSGGIKVALAPLITDLPIIALTFLAFSTLSHTSIFMSLISFLGGIFLVYLGFECLKIKVSGSNIQNRKSLSLIKGIIANILNPHPYLFWITVGTPTALKAYQINSKFAVFYFASFYTLLLGSKICVAIIVERSRTLITGTVYIWIMRVLGFSLFIFAAFFFSDSIKNFVNIITQ